MTARLVSCHRPCSPAGCRQIREPCWPGTSCCSAAPCWAGASCWTGPAGDPGLARHPGLDRCPLLDRHPRLDRRSVLDRQHPMTAGRQALAAVHGPDADALADPDRARAKHAPQFARARQVNALTRAERKVLVIAGQVAIKMAQVASTASGGCIRGGTGVRAHREPVVRIWPGCGLVGILPRGADPLGELR